MAEAFAQSRTKPGTDYYNGLYLGFLAGYQALENKISNNKTGGYTKYVCLSGYGCQYQFPNETDCKSPVGCVHKRTVTYCKA